MSTENNAGFDAQKIEVVLVGQLIPNPSNPRTIKDEKFKQLVKSIQEFPKMLFIRPIVVNEDMVVLGGNMRLKACIAAGLTEVPIIKTSQLTEDEQRRFIITDNVGYGEWDFELLKADWQLEELSDWGLELPNFEKLDEEYVAPERPEVAEDDDYEVPEDGLETTIELGDVIKIGNHTLVCGSATQAEDWEKLMEGKLCNLIVTDPPYNVAYVGKTEDAMTIDNDSMSDGDFRAFLLAFYRLCEANMEKGAAIYVWHADSEGANFRSALVEAGIMLKQCLIWVKNSMVMGRQDYHWQHEPCLYGWKGGAAHNWYTDRRQTTVLNFDRPNRNAEHPTMKPIPLFSYQIGNSSKESDVVVDCFGGSGTTMVACELMGREARLMELAPRYCQVIVDRMVKLRPDIVVTRNGEPFQR